MNNNMETGQEWLRKNKQLVNIKIDNNLADCEFIGDLLDEYHQAKLKESAPQQPSELTDEMIHSYWKRKNCFGHYFEGLVDGSKFARDLMQQYKASQQEQGYTREQFNGMKEAMQEFVDRCDKGEVRSKKTYSKFKEILKSIPPSQQATKPSVDNGAVSKQQAGVIKSVCDCLEPIPFGRKGMVDYCIRCEGDIKD
jgi:hypothetical protein